MAQKTLLLSYHAIYSVFQLCPGAWYLANKWLVYCRWGTLLLTWCSWILTLVRERPAMLIATCSQMNAPVEQLRSMKCPQCASSIWWDIGQALRMLETFPCCCYGARLPREPVLESAWACLFMSFQNFCAEELASNLSLGVISMSVKWRKWLHYCQITPFLVFFSFAWERDIWPIND